MIAEIRDNGQLDWSHSFVVEEGNDVTLLSQVAGWIRHAAQRIWHSLRPLSSGSQVMAVDVSRSRRDLIIENTVLRHQVNIRRDKKRPRLGATDRLILLLGSSLLPTWRRAIALVQPDTLLRWHRAGFRLFWRLRSRPRRDSPLAQETIDLIRDMARRGRLWGAERIQGELLKLGITVCKRTIQKYMRGVRSSRGGQTWATFLKNHAEDIWACDFVQTYDILRIEEAPRLMNATVSRLPLLRRLAPRCRF